MMQNPGEPGIQQQNDTTMDTCFVGALRKSLEEPAYMSLAVQSLARDLSIEIMENTYGVPFR